MAKARIIRKHGAAVVVMAFDEEGQVRKELLVGVKVNNKRIRDIFFN